MYSPLSGNSSFRQGHPG